jgi:hypothetical protein
VHGHFRASAAVLTNGFCRCLGGIYFQSHSRSIALVTVARRLVILLGCGSWDAGPRNSRRNFPSNFIRAR